jgi:hypothetical protein
MHPIAVSAGVVAAAVNSRILASADTIAFDRYESSSESARAGGVGANSPANSIPIYAGRLA